MSRRRYRLPGGRLHLGTVADIKSERWPASRRNGWPASVGIRSPREAHVLGRDNRIDFSAYIINNLAVLGRYRRHGIAAHLIERTAGTAHAEGFAFLQLQVWADTTPARALYAKSGFVAVSRTDVPWHPALPREGGRITLQRRLTAAADMTSVTDALGPGEPVCGSTGLSPQLRT